MDKKNLLSVVLFLSAIACFAQENKAISELRNSRALSNAIIGICIQDMQGKELVSLNKNLSITPASTLKIVTTATALEILGSNYRFRTELLADKEQKSKLIVRGYGDPTLGSEHVEGTAKDFLNKWVEEIQKKFGAGLTEIEIDDSYFGYEGISRHWIREDTGNYYATGSYGISVFDNAYKLYFDTRDKTGRPQIVKTEPEMSGMSFTNTLSLNTTGKDNGYIVGEPFSNNRLLIGDIPEGRASFSIKGDIPDPGLYLGRTLAGRLNKNGEELSYHTLRANFDGKLPPKDGEVFYTHLSPPLKNIVRVVNVKSNNHYAEHLIRAIGKTTGNLATDSAPLRAGTDLINQYWQSKSLDTASLFMYDGCGLSPSDAISPKLMCNILAYMYDKSKNAETFLASFPKAGQEGTVRNFLKDAKLSGKVLVKSGSIANVQCYAGYYINGEKKYAFTIMVNNFRKNSRVDVVEAIEAFLEKSL
ncbi:D-alanyl-D-alanine carboxypeptidase/D-alanyl-D-alanine endopeptidase [Viscerimonas tarda]